MSKISILHISDLHFGKSRTKSVDDFYSTITNDLKQKGINVDVVICTGDIIDGKVQDKDAAFERAIGFFENLMRRINIEKLYNTKELTVEDFLFVPGNHDVMRSEEVEVRHEKYNQFLDKFYGTTKVTLYDEKNCFVTKIYPNEKIAFVGLNSCMGKSTLTQQDETWIEKLDYKSLNLENDKEVELKDFLIKSKTTYNDYGEIETSQILEAFDKLKSQADDIDTYRIVAFFHHHIYPFPEIYDKYGDSSMIRNFSTIIQTLIDKNVKFVFHGHKHIPISRLVTTNRYFENTQKCLWVFSTGTLENEGQRAFEVADIYSPNEMLEAEISKFNYSAEELQKVDQISVPPIPKGKNNSGSLIDVLQRKDSSLFEKYRNNIKSYDNTSHHYHIDKIIENIEKILLNFEGINHDLDRDSKLIFLILSCIHLRILNWDSIHRQKDSKNKIKQIQDILQTEYSFDNEYFSSIQTLLSSIKIADFNKYFKEIYEKDTFNQNKKITSYIAITSFFTDLYLVISDFGEQYFNDEGICHKINIKLEKNVFDEKISNESISIVGEEDRRSATISFDCQDPTAHKASVLIIKDFEERINKIEDAFKHLNLKLYYVRPKVRKSGYEMDNYNFEAYIPTLLPLLTGDNLYAQKEVFVRELIQNSFDAIQLREKLETATSIDTTIKIQIGKDTEKNKRYLRIIDEGVGMDIYKIERYFTSIGRSFYRSRDFDELQKEKKIAYKALSNFGIGFLSVFMVGKEVVVKTKSLWDDYGINIHIPNYEGCFFINKDETIKRTGTEITIYEDERNLLITQNIKKFIAENFIDFKYNIQLDYPKNSIPFKSFKKRAEMRESGFIFIPFDKDNVSQLKKYEIGKDCIFDHYNHGYLLDIKNYNIDNKCTFLNEGIKVNACNIKEFKELPFDGIFNFPSSLIELNVSRDQIIGFKSGKDTEAFCKELRRAITEQVSQLIEYYKQKKRDVTLSTINNLVSVGMAFTNNKAIQNQSYFMSIKKNNEKFFLCLTTNQKDKIDDDAMAAALNDFVLFSPKIILELLKEFFPNLFDFFQKIIPNKDFLEDILRHEYLKGRYNFYNFIENDVLSSETLLQQYEHEPLENIFRKICNEHDKTLGRKDFIEDYYTHYRTYSEFMYQEKINVDLLNNDNRNYRDIISQRIDYIDDNEQIKKGNIAESDFAKGVINRMRSALRHMCRIALQKVRLEQLDKNNLYILEL